VHLLNTVTIDNTGAACNVTLKPQTVNRIKYSNSGGKRVVTPEVTGITYTSTGGLCGSSGTNGTFTGTSELERVGGGSLTFDP